MVGEETTTTTTMMMMMSPPKARYKLLEARRRRMETTTTTTTTTKSSASDASDGTVAVGVDEGTRAGANSRRANDRAADRSGRERESSAAALARR